MPDLYKINLHLQECLERDWLEEVPVPEASRWLQRVGLLPNFNNWQPLRRLLHAGRIAGQVRRPNKEHGAWIIRRIAQSRDPQEIEHARSRIRRYLPLDRSIYPPDWPLSTEKPEFWQELGKTIAAFGYLEHELVLACDALTPPPALPQDLPREQIPEYLEWYARLLARRTDTLRVLTDRLRKLLKKDSRIPHSVRADLSRELDELRPWRNALCHGAWFGVDSDRAGCLAHFYKREGRVRRFKSRVTQRDLFRPARQDSRYNLQVGGSLRCSRLQFRHAHYHATNVRAPESPTCTEVERRPRLTYRITLQPAMVQTTRRRVQSAVLHRIGPVNSAARKFMVGVRLVGARHNRVKARRQSG